MPAVYNSAIIGIRLRIIAIEVANFFLQSLQKKFGDLPMHENIVGRDARMPCIHEFTPGNALTRNIRLGCIVYNDRAFSSEFERDGN